MVMMNSAWNKNNCREIKHTFGRYIAILIITALGVGFFSGLKVTKEAMIQTGDTYIKESRMYDYRLLSTLGLTKEDVDYFSKLDGIKAAEGAVSVDFITDFGSSKDIILKAHSITDNINKLKVTVGRMPEEGNECIVDALYFSEQDIGKTIRLSDINDQDTVASFAYREYTIVGLCNSVSYMYRSDRGTTKLAGGTVHAFLYIPEGGFSQDYFNEVYVTLTGGGEIFSTQYDKKIADMKQPLTEALKSRAELRYQSIVDEVDSKVREAQMQYDSSYKDYLSKRSEANKGLKKSWRKLENAKSQLDLDSKKLAESEKTLAASSKDYEQAYEAYQSSKSEYKAKKSETFESLAAKQEEISKNRSTVTSTIEKIENRGISKQYTSLKESKTSLEEALSKLGDQNSTEYVNLSRQLNQVNQKMAQIEASKTFVQYQTLKATQTQLEAVQAELTSAKKSAKEQLAITQAQLDATKAQLDTAKAIIETGKSKILDGKAKLKKAKEEYEHGLSKYYAVKDSTENALSDAKTKLTQAKNKINDAKGQIRNIKKPSTYLLDRNKNTGYASFENDSSVVEGIAKVFPIFFFLVAALVCSTTMTRMVDEQRTQIGTLKALGFSNRIIAWKYVSYSGSAAVLGCILGYYTGTKLFPLAIWQAYKMLYNFAEIRYVFNPWLALLTLIVSLLCSVGATYAACRTELSQMPAELMRPKAPKAGKRILLEHIPFLWRKISFLRKVSIRNIMRYKKRLIMMILGIGGCSSLLLAGFGLNDSISNIADDQFGTIMMYDYTISFSDAKNENEMKTFIDDTSGLLSKCVFVSTDTYDVTNGRSTQKVNVIASDDPDITKVIGLHLNGVTVPFPKDGYAAINERLAETCGVTIGGKLTINLNNTESYTVTIGGVFKNYAYNYMYMSGKTYEEVFGRKCAYKTAYATTNSNKLYDISAKLMKDYGAANVIVTADTRSRVDNMMKSLNYVIWLVIASACALAFVVMYNLSNINITERNREIATIKVLGFYSFETYSYVFRENIVITIISTMLGLPAGILLHRFVMAQIQIESVSFKIQVLPMSFLYALVITFGLTIIVNLVLMRKIDRINMAESLKSVE